MISLTSWPKTGSDNAALDMIGADVLLLYLAAKTAAPCMIRLYAFPRKEMV